MRILLFGKNGQVGWELQRFMAPLGEIIALGRQEADLGDFERLREVVRGSKPDLIVNAAAYTDVDGAESNKGLAMRVNAEAPGVIADEAKKLGALLVHYSTDYVFDGEKGEPYVETDVPNPINVYGASKLAGERAIQEVGGAYLILRTAWVYSLRGDNFVTKVLRWAREKETLRIVADQISNPTWSRMLGEMTASILARDADYIKERTGLYNLAAGGQASRLEWAREILGLDPRRDEQITREVIPAAANEFTMSASRPPFSALDGSAFSNDFELTPPDWGQSLKLAMMD